MYEKLIRDIQTATNNHSLPIEIMVDLAAEYSEACETVNQRLATIGGLLAAGYRDEAVQLADARPNVLDAVYELDFEERPIWIERLADNQLELPPDVMVDVASQLEHAQGELRRLEPLLKKNRLLALSQASIQSRIIILKKLAKHDPINPIWLDDCEALQRSRIVQIQSEFNRAKALKNASQIELLANELQSNWDIPIPKSLIDNVTQASSALANDHARQVMADISKQLNNCLMEFDTSSGLVLRDQWHRLNESAQLAPDDELNLSVQEPLSWLAELDQEKVREQEFESALKAIESALVKQVPIGDLDQAVYEAHKFDREVPEPLMQRVEHYRRSILSAKYLKIGLLVGISGVIVISIVIGIVLMISSSAAKNVLRQAQGQMQQFENDGNYQAGRDLFETLPDKLKTDGEISQSYNRLVEEHNEEQARKAEFDRAMAEIDLDQSLDFDLNDAMNLAEKLASTGEEKASVAALERKIVTLRNQKQEERNRKFIEQLEPHQTRLETLLGESNRPTLIGELSALKAGVQRLVDSHGNWVEGMEEIGSDKRDIALRIIRQANEKITEIKDANKSATALSEIKRDLKDFRRFARALNYFAKQYPEDPNAADFLASANEQSTWNGFEQWAKLASKISAEDISRLSLAEASSLFEGLQAARENLELSDWQDAIEKMESHLAEKKENRHVNARMHRLKSAFNDDTYLDVFVVERDGELYYVVEEIDLKEKPYFKYRIRDKTPKVSRLESTDIYGEAPHCELAQTIRAAIDQADEHDTNQLIIGLLELVLARPAKQANQKLSLDPLVQCEFVDQILLFASSVSPSLKSFAERHRTEIKAQKIVDVEWELSKDKSTNNARKRAQRFVDELRPKLQNARDVIKSKENNLKTMSAWIEISEIQVAGFVYRDQSSWVVDTILEIEPNTPAYCLVPGEKNTTELVKIGNIGSGTLTDVNEDSEIQAGRPVYIRQQKTR